MFSQDFSGPPSLNPKLLQQQIDYLSMSTTSLPLLHSGNPEPPQADTPKLSCRKVNSTDESAHAIHFEYLAEGAANIVFSIEPGPSKSGDAYVFIGNKHNFLEKVLRISKGGSKTLKCHEVIAGFENEVRPLFPEAVEKHLMTHDEVHLSEDVIKELLKELDHHKLLSRSVRLEPWGILLPNMSSGRGSDSITIEIKPKWLSQSPNAPRDAYRCRNCALQASRQAKSDSTYICPLRLLTDNDSTTAWIGQKVTDALQITGHSPADGELDPLTERVTRYLLSGNGQRLLKHIRDLQLDLDPHGILERESCTLQSTEEFERRLRLAMTLRDCSLFVKAPYDEHRAIESKLGDLDFKSAAKLEDWKDKELALTNGGWYTSLDPSNCLISEGWKKHVPYHW